MPGPDVRPSRAPARGVRAVLLAALVLALSALAHRAGGGLLPPPPVLLGLAALTLAGTTAAARVRWTAPRLVGVLGASQLALHGALGALGGHDAGTGAAGCAPGAGAAAATAGHGLRAGHAAAGHDVVALAGCVPLGGVAHADPAGMVLAHAAATVLLALVVARGERSLHRLLAGLAWLALPSERTLPALGDLPPVGRATPARSCRVRALPARCARDVAPVRGPPSAGPLVVTAA